MENRTAPQRQRPVARISAGFPVIDLTPRPPIADLNPYAGTRISAGLIDAALMTRSLKNPAGSAAYVPGGRD